MLAWEGPPPKRCWWYKWWPWETIQVSVNGGILSWMRHRTCQKCGEDQFRSL